MSAERRMDGMMDQRVGLRIGLAGFALALGLALAAPAFATQASFASGGWGFNPAGLAGLPVGSSADPNLLAAGESGAFANLDVEFTGSTQICVLAPGSSACQAANPALTGPFSVLVSLTLNVLNESLDGSFTLMLTSLVGGLGYTPSDVVIELNPAVPAGLNTSAVPGFVWNGGFTPFVRVRDLYDAPTSIYDYIGWTVEDGTTLTFRYDVLTSLKDNTYPTFTANALPLVVPEPGAAILLGLGLAGLASYGERRGWRGRSSD